MKAIEIEVVAVIGAGTMGAGIAGEFARAGCEVRLVDRDEDALDRGMEMLRVAQESLVKAGFVTAESTDMARKRVSPVTMIEEAGAGVQLLVEAAPEDILLKQELFARFDGCCPKEAILASNTSGLSITTIAGATSRPGQVAGMHFWNPPHIIPLVEVTKGELTADATAQTLLDVCRRLGKRPILVRHDVPGFVGNRIQFAIMREALHILSEGIASAEDIDTAMTAGPGLRYALIGPLRTADLGGLDVFNAISEYLFGELNSGAEVPRALGELVKQGKLGAKTGAGFYEYPGKAQGEIVRRRDRLLLEFLRVLKQEPAE